MDNKEIKNSELGSDARDLRVKARETKEEGTRKINRLWLWFGILILIFILAWILWTLGVFGGAA